MQVRLVLFAALVALAGPAAAADFVGPESCRACHAAAFDAWKESPHARAMGSLSGEQQKDGRCLQCHARDAALGGEAGVTCETCHGAGQFYWPAYVMRDGELARATGLVLPDAKGCLQCHDGSSPSLEPFDPAAKLKVIDHWSASRAARQAKGKKAEACPRPHAPTAALVRPDEGLLSRALRTPAAKAPDAPRVALAGPAAAPSGRN